MTQPHTDTPQTQGPRMTYAELKAAVAGRWHEIFEDLAHEQLGLALANAPFHVPCPVHGGENGFRLFAHFPETGRGICNTCGPQGNGFKMLAWVKKIDIKDAVREVGQWYRKGRVNIVDAKPRPVPKMLPKVDPAEAYARIARVWKSSLELAGSPAERYLVKRGIWRENIPRVLRAHPGLTYVYGKEKKNYGKFPCLLAPIKDKDNRLVSIHRIFLTENGDKAPVPDAKKMMSQHAEIRGAAIKLFPAEGEVLGLAEGIETALAAHAVSRMPVWSCVSAPLLELVDVPAHVKHVVIWADLDRSERGLQAAEKLATRLEAEGKTVEICMPMGEIPNDDKGIDWLDVMLTQGLNGFPARWRQWRPAMTPETFGAIVRAQQQPATSA